ncbi:MAG: hypothetical protein WC389_04310 [Lutibacter sp.]|jgi:hypothetical protein
MNKLFSTCFLLIFSFSTLFAQKSINSYKYIIVPKQFEFQKSPDQHQVNSLAKFLFERAGFTVFFTDESFPTDLANDRCLALMASVNNASNFLNTKLRVDLLDCYNKVVFSTEEGKSKEKDYKTAYHEALRNAFVGIEALKYSYEATLGTKEKVSAENKTEKPTVKEIVPVAKIEEAPETPKVPMKVAEQIVVKEAREAKNETVKSFVTPVVNSIEGKYFVDKWGECKISAKEGYYAFVGGDEKFEFATIYKTSIPNLFIIKWAAFKQPRLLELSQKGDLKVEDENGDTIYKRLK